MELNGEFFEVLVKEGDQITAGQPLITFDMDAISKKGYSLTTPVIVTNTNDYTKVSAVKIGKTELCEKILTVE